MSAPSSTAAAPETSIPIFVDPQFEAQEGEGEAEQSVYPHHQPAANVLSVRRQLDTLETIAKNPLARHTKATSAPASAATTAVPPIPVAKPEQAVRAKAPEELPVFTAAAPPPCAASVVAPTSLNQARQALHKPASVKAAAGFAIFCDDNSETASAAKKPSSSRAPAVAKGAATAFSIYDTSSTSSSAEGSADCRVQKSKATAMLAPAPAFDIFVDEAPAAASSKQAVPAAPRSAAGQSFAIFESPAKPASAVPTRAPANTVTAGFDIYADEPVAPRRGPTAAPAVSGPAPSSSSSGFDIYMDEPAVHMAPVPAAPRSGHTSSTFDIYVDEPAVTTAAVAAAEEGLLGEDDQDCELHAILDNMMQLDSEDGTINTRLAKRDIDLMFCSPTIHRAPAAAATTRRQGGEAAATISDENSFCLRKPEPAFERALFKAGSDDEDHLGSSFVGNRTGRKPLQEADCSRIMEEEAPSFDQFDNDAAESTAQKLSARGEGPGVMLKARHRPFGVHLDNPFSAVKDLSAIKEVRFLCG